MGGHWRIESPPCGFSTLTTSAPMSASSMPQKGPAATAQNSMTLTPDRGKTMEPPVLGSVQQVYELQALHLARRTARQLGHEVDRLGRLEAAEVAHAELAQLLGGAVAALAADHAGHDLLAVMLVRDTHGRGVEHRGVLQEHLVDLARGDVLPALDDELLDAAGDEEEAVGVAHAHVAAAEPAAGEKRA